LSEEHILEIEAADRLVIGTPMNNFTVRSVRKAWIDQIVPIQRSFAPSPTGAKGGLLTDRPMPSGIAKGGPDKGGQPRRADFLTPCLSAVLGCIGLKTLRFLPLQGTAFLPAEQLSTKLVSLVAEHFQ